MADQTNVLGWVGAAIGNIALLAGGFSFLIRRIDTVDEKVNALKVNSADMIVSTRREAAEALLAHSQRTDSRQEAVRQELNTQVREIHTRIDRMGNDMARKEDVQEIKEDVRGVGLQIGSLRQDLQTRIDKLIDARGLK